MKYLYVINSSEFFCSHFFHVANSILEKGHEVHIACGDSVRAEDIEKAGMKFHLLKLDRKSRKIIYEFISILSIRKIILSLQPQIIHFFTIKPVLYGCLSCRLLYSTYSPRIIIASVTGLGSLYLSNSFFEKFAWFLVKIIYKFSFNNPDVKVVFENENDLDLFTNEHIVNKKQSNLINGAGVDTSLFIPSQVKNDKFTVVLVARLLKDKGISEYIEAGRLLKEREIDVILQLVGDIDEHNISSMSRGQIIEADSHGYIQYLGHRNDIYNIYKQAHVGCLPSYREGLPKSLIEATSCGLAIITTDVPGCRQIIHTDEYGSNGILVPAQNEIALADAIEFLYHNQSIAKDMGERSRTIALEKFDMSKVKQKFHELYYIH
ncbi:glycosyltransferase family 4 protein [Vibrio mangrovi]|uniref:Glycosyltransferase family 4 protein n=1 Tax=Vibrio mangrovi TaxID=474394 RepID=A0A1Y6IV46_9VIBR|nr:glycosyltransferase family 4 protein [Vibrio mangrovi]MDW6002189.1 glycosyltransferase family 4 protein [Vibrio mangrovi]SMS01534.1 N, N'-diacetylbacillosaminyl-diphospho-undecaprenol alpha-1,3-N-acetylgalactosaminyltransferase [Vibrio mangrovi]